VSVRLLISENASKVRECFHSEGTWNSCCWSKVRSVWLGLTPLTC